MVSFETRNSFSDTTSDVIGIGAARRWIKSEMERCNAECGGRMKIEFDEHLARVAQPTPIINNVTTLAGEQTESRDRIYLVSGHYDSMRSTLILPGGLAPGANDDASGTTAVIELACMMSKYKYNATLIFMPVAGKEQGLLGSTFFAKAAKAKGLNIDGMITNDIIGNTRGSDGKVVRDRYLPKMKVDLVYRRDRCLRGGDHFPFLDQASRPCA